MGNLKTKKFIALLTIVLFVTLLGYSTSSQFPQSQEKGKTKTNSGEKKEKLKREGQQEFTEYFSRDGGNVLEQDWGEEKKKKKFPWLLVIGGVVVVGVALFFLLKKNTPEKYNLVVTLGEGVTGSPASGTHSHEKGTNVSYNYTLKSGFTNLTVTLDGQVVPPSGNITMNAAHALSATASQVARVNINSTPQGAHIIMDGADTGHTTNQSYTFTSEGPHDVVLRKLGYKEYQDTVNAVLGSTQNFNATLTAGLEEKFSSGATSSIFWQWEPHPEGNWNVSGGEYSCDAKLSQWNYSIYAYKFTKNQYTVTVKMKRSEGSENSSNSIILSTTDNADSVSGYLFNYTTGGWISLWKYTNKNLVTGTGNTSNIQGWRKHTAVNKFRGSWNVFKIVRDGSNYSYYLNDILTYSFSDSTYDPGYLILAGYNGGLQTVLSFDHAYWDVGVTNGSVLGAPVSAIPVESAKDGHPGYHKKK